MPISSFSEVHMRFTKTAVALSLGFALGATGLLAQDQPDGKALYETNCVKCHGQDGVPPEVLASRVKNLKPLNDPAVYEGVSVDSTAVLLDNGIGLMKPYKGVLTKDEELAIARYIRTLAKKDTAGVTLPPRRAPIS
jgi:mono/diheme cytochrome c family protein